MWKTLRKGGFVAFTLGQTCTEKGHWTQRKTDKAPVPEEILPLLLYINENVWFMSFISVDIFKPLLCFGKKNAMQGMICDRQLEKHMGSQ